MASRSTCYRVNSKYTQPLDRNSYMLAQQDNTVVTDPQLWNHQAKWLQRIYPKGPCSLIAQANFKAFLPLMDTLLTMHWCL